MSADPPLCHRELFAWALPRLGLDAESFIRLGGQVRKRVGRRVSELGLADLSAYRAFLEAHPEEWAVLDACCHVTITRFFRDRSVFELLEQRVLPELASRAEAEGARDLSVWSAGSAAGEEAYSLALLWHYRVARAHPAVRFGVLGTELDPVSLARAAARSYPAGCLREVPGDIREHAFERRAGRSCLREDLAEGVRFQQGDLRREMPRGPFDLVACRNLAFTYFDVPTRRAVLAGLLERLRPHGFLLIGRREELPETPPSLRELAPGSRLYRFSPER